MHGYFVASDSKTEKRKTTIDCLELQDPCPVDIELEKMVCSCMFSLVHERTARYIVHTLGPLDPKELTAFIISVPCGLR